MSNKTRLSDTEREEIVAFLAGELHGKAARKVQHLLKHNSAAREEAESLRRAWAILDNLPKKGSSADFTSRTVEKLAAIGPAPKKIPVGDSASTPASNAWPFIALACSVALAALTLFAAVRSRPRTVDLDTDPVFAKEPRIIENLQGYLAVGDIDFLKALNRLDRFAVEDPYGFMAGELP